jgi:hypothetical protein
MIPLMIEKFEKIEKCRAGEWWGVGSGEWGVGSGAEPQNG